MNKNKPRVNISAILERSGIAADAKPGRVTTIAEEKIITPSVRSTRAQNVELEKTVNAALQSLGERYVPDLLEKYKDVKESKNVSLKEEIGFEAFEEYLKDWPVEVREVVSEVDIQFKVGQGDEGISPKDSTGPVQLDQGLIPRRGRT